MSKPQEFELKLECEPNKAEDLKRHLAGAEETAMLRFVVVLGLCCMAVATTAVHQSAKAVNDQALCFDTWTTLDAGGPVSDDALAAAQNACARLQQSPQDSLNREKIRRAVVAITEEVQHRHATPH